MVIASALLAPPIGMFWSPLVFMTLLNGKDFTQLFLVAETGVESSGAGTKNLIILCAVNDESLERSLSNSSQIVRSPAKVMPRSADFT